MKVDGGCHCGAIAYEADADPNSVGICHCTDCQRLTGTAFRTTVRARADSFVLLRGTPSIYIKTAESGNRRAHAFCPHCGSPIYAAAVTNPTSYSLRLGGITQRAAFEPRLQVWCDSALPWSFELAKVDRLARQ
jgi:hypothetical protein